MCLGLVYESNQVRSCFVVLTFECFFAQNAKTFIVTDVSLRVFWSSSGFTLTKCYLSHYLGRYRVFTLLHIHFYKIQSKLQLENVCLLITELTDNILSCFLLCC